ncbi:MAG: radical SAM protein [bacterium]
MSILLINPWIYDFAAYDLWAKPLGLLYIASILRKYSYEVNFIDCLDRHHPNLPKPCKIKEYGQGKYYSLEIEKPSLYKDIPKRYKRYGIPLDVFEAELKAIDKPAVILVTSMMTYWYPGVFDAIKILRNYFNDIPIILGGIYATLCYEHAVKYSGADYIIKGKNILPVLKLVDNLTKNTHNYSNFPAELDKYPYPAYDLIRKLDYVCILTSIGCPYRCSYCATHLLSPEFIQRNPLNVVDKIGYYYRKFNLKNFAFYDDALLINAENHICIILEEIAKRGVKCNFHTPNAMHINSLNKSLAHLLFKSNFKTIRLGFETSSPSLQKRTGGKVTNQEFKSAVKNLISAGYQSKDIEVYVMTGLPGQSEKEVIDSINFVASTGAKIKLVEFSPIPGTKEWCRTGLDSDADPLLHNNSLLLFQGHESYQRLKELMNKHNHH